MKNTVLLLVTLFSGLGYCVGQIPIQKNKAFILKLSATWCEPCGVWGVPLSDQLIDSVKGDAFFASAYPSKFSSWHDSDFFCLAAQQWNQQLSGGDFPGFSANFIDKSSTAGSPGEIDAGVHHAINAYMFSDVEVSTGFTFDIVGNVITVKTRTRFWKNAEGQYYLSVFILEDSVAHCQNGQTDEQHTIPNRYVLRGSMTASGWGDLILQGPATVHQTIDSTYTFEIKNSTWNQSKLKVATILFKKSGSIYQYVNGWDIPSLPDGVKEERLKGHMSIFPNPTTDKIHLTMHLNEEASGSIAIMDITGKMVYQSEGMKWSKGDLDLLIPLSGLKTGLYSLLVSTSAGSEVLRFTVK